MRGLFLSVLVLAIVSCDKLPTAQKEPTGALGEVARAAVGFMTPGTQDRDLVFEEFLADLGLQKTYGSRATEIEEQIRKSRLAAARQISRVGPGGRHARVSAALGVFIVPYFAQALASYLDVMTKPGARTQEDPPMSQTTTETGATSTSVTTLRISQTAGGVQGRVTLTVVWAYHTTTKDNASSAVLVEMDDSRTIVGAITVCPDEQGQVNAVVSVKSDFRAVASGSTSTRGIDSNTVFTGHVSDAASLTNVHQTTQDTEEWSSPSGDGRVEAVISSTTATNASGEMATADASTFTGTLNASGSEAQRAARFAGWTIALDSAAIQPSYKEAQRLFRGGRCVVVVAPDFNAETPIEVGEQEKPQHDEEVDPDSEKDFAVRLKHRFSGGELRLPLKAQLTSGEEKLEPEELGSGSGSLKYKAPSEEGKKATALLRSTSKRGIGTLALDFHTGGSLTLTLTGTVTGNQGFGMGFGDRSVTDKVTMGPFVFKKGPLDAFVAMGTWTSEIHHETNYGPYANVCDGRETGQAQLVARMEMRGADKVWVIDPRNSVAATGPGSMVCVTTAPGTSTRTTEQTDGASGGLFLQALGEIVVPKDGGTFSVRGQSNFGGNWTAQGTADAKTD
jgi:hypothetical protein